MLSSSPFESYTLPSHKPTTLMSTLTEKAAHLREKPTQSVKVVEEEKEFAFLPGIMGIVLPPPKESPVRAMSESRKKRLGDTSKSAAESEVTLLPPVVEGSGGAAVSTQQPKLQTDEVAALLTGIVNGIDGINFFARFGSETLIKFIHLVYEFSRERAKQHPRYYQPYSLLVTTRPVTNMEHFIMSPAGLVHVCANEPSECIPLSTWMRESILFSILRKIPFFKLYLYRKSFSIWSDNVRFALFVKQRNKVQEKLFVTRKTSCMQLLNIKTYLLEILKIPVLNVEFKTTVLEDFLAQSNKKCLDASREIEEYVQKIIVEVENVIADVTNIYNKANQDDSNSLTSYSDNVNADKVKSLVKIKEEKQQLKLLRIKAKQEYNSLTDFIRFVDTMVVETLVTLVIDTIMSFNHLISFQDDSVRATRKAGLFEIVVTYCAENDSHVFNPARDEVLGVLNNILDGVIESIGGVRRVRFIYPKISSEGADIQKIVRENRDYKEASHSILDRVIEDFLKADEHTLSYQSIKPMHKTHNFLDDLNMDQPDVNLVREKIDRLSNWSKELEKLRNKPVGVLEIDSKKLKIELEVIRETRLRELKDFIKEAAKEKGQYLVEHYRDCVARLNAKPVHLKDFAAYLAMVEGFKADQVRYFKSINQVDLLYKLLTEIDPAGTADQLVILETLDELHAKETSYRNDMLSVRAFKDSKMPDMVESLVSLQEKLADNVSFVVARLGDAIFTKTSQFGNADKVLEEIEALSQRVELIEQNSQTYASYQRVMGIPVTSNPELEICNEKLDVTKTLWQTIKKWNDCKNSWYHDDFTSLNVESIDKEVQGLFKESHSLHKANETDVSEQLRNSIGDFRTILPIILDLGNPAMTPVHFEKLFKVIDVSYSPEIPFSLTHMLEGGILNFKEVVSETSGVASGEAQLIADLTKIKTNWDRIQFTVINHRDQAGLYVLGGLDEIFAALDDNQVTLQTMLGNRFVVAIQSKVEEWVKKLSLVSETLDEWITCQRNWMYLEAIFGAEDIQKQLPAESQQFVVIDRSFKGIMNRTYLDPLVLSCLLPLDNGQNVLQTFLNNNAGLESIQKSLEDYLETKRMAFPRFYFLSNDELLEILSQTRDPLAVQPHMSKCFDAIKSLKFRENKKSQEIIGFSDPGGEYVPLSHPVKAEGAVEVWLLQFEKAMRLTLFDQSKNAFIFYPSSDEESIHRAEWLWSSAAQVIIVIDQILWTLKVSNAIAAVESGAYPKAISFFLTFSLKQIDAMVALVRTPLDKQRRTLLGALLTIDVHARDVVRSLEASKISSLTSFEWTKQLRYYWDAKVDDAFARQTNSSFRYGYEYLGNGPRLVITPLTDVCYMTLTVSRSL